MKQKRLCLLLAVLLLLAAIPCAWAEGEDPAPAGEDPTPPATTLTATGGVFPYDGKPHAVTYTLTNGDAYVNVYFSVDDGKTWTKTAPSLTKVGKLIVTVRAVKEGGQDPLNVTVKLEVVESAASGSTLTIVNCNAAVNVREKATSNSRKLGQAKKGKTFPLLAVEGNWYKIQYTADKAGYVFHTYGKVGSGTVDPDPDPQPTGSVGTIVNVRSGVNVRAKATSSSKSLGKAHNGDVFQVLGVTGRWVKVSYQGGAAYIYDHYIRLSGDPVTPAPATGEKAYIVNVKTQVNVRKAASSNSKKLGVLKKGAEVTVTGTSGKWTQIAYNGGTAYVYSCYVSATKPDADVAGKTATIVNCTNAVNVRAKANSSSKKLGEAKKGATYTIQGLSGNWVKVDYNGQTGFIYKRFVQIG